MVSQAWARGAVLWVASTLLLAGCGGDSNGDSLTGSATGTATNTSSASSDGSTTVTGAGSTSSSGTGTTPTPTPTTTSTSTDNSAGDAAASVLTGSTGATLQSGCTTAIAKPTLDTSSASSFGLTTSSTYYTVDTGAGLVFKVRRGDYSASTQAPGDLASLVYKGVEYQDTSAGTQLNAGAGYLYTDTNEDAVVVDAALLDADHIRITVTAGDMTHYYLARRGDPRVYMGTIFASEPNQVNEGFVRYLVRALKSQVPTGPAASDLTDITGTIESADIFGTANGETRSKHYSNQRLRDWYYIGAQGSGVGMWVVRGNSEGMSGGPFYRSLLNQGTSTQQQLTYIINYGMAQTEAFRTSVLNTYALAFTDGSAPDIIDTSWYADMGLKGWVGASGAAPSAAPG